ncbi:phosphosulfolactate synthase [Evansella vedderi]|uniref:phosphosulfolactate synthase n=1 Tax=Evansella vedderi TaxID=38282 RepID=UPI0027D836F1|nr:phosphosulfolactate synthase [Evansella vedderi]
MNISGLTLPYRQAKPRNYGLTIVIDNGLPLQLFKDTIRSSADLVDLVKFGWGTSLVTKQIQEKIQCLQEHQVEFFFGGTLFEKFVSQGKTNEFYNYCKRYQCNFVEISNGTIPLTNIEKAKFISEFSNEFLVLSEVGRKDGDQSEAQSSEEWIEYIQQDFEAGAFKVITEARESGTSGICTRNGDIKLQILENIFSAEIPLTKMIFEAPNKKLQTLFINKLGSNVNLANIPFTDIIPLETLRLGLRSDTFHIINKIEETTI